MLTSAMMLAACNPGADAGEKKNAGSNSDELVIAHVREPDTVDIHNTTWTDDANTHLYGTLFRFDDEGNVIDGLVEDYKVSDDSKSVTFTLKEGLKFHNGNPITAEAVVSNLQRYLDVSHGTHLGPIESMEALDDRTFVINWETPFAPFFSNTTTSNAGGVLDTSVLDADNAGFEKNPVASGPLKHVETKRGESITYEPFEDYYWGEAGAPEFKKVTFRFVPDDETRMLEFKKGSVNVLTDVPPQSIKELEADKDVTVQKVLDAGNTYIGFNMKRPKFEDIRVRQALALAIDRTPIVEQALQGAAQPIYGPLPPTIFGYSQEVEDKAKDMYSYDKEKAKQLLADAGWDETNGKGIVMKDGEPLTIELWSTDEPAMQRIGQIVQNQLAEIGVDLKLVVKEDSAIRAQLPEGAHEMVIWQYGWYDADILQALFGKDQSTRMHWEPEDLNSMLVDASAEMDMDQRLKDYEEIGDYLVENSPWIPLFVREKVTAFRGVEGLHKHPISDMLIWDGAKFGN
ncbi:ABC transporter substrate-binding protein [Bhargavaea ullalensis]